MAAKRRSQATKSHERALPAPAMKRARPDAGEEMPVPVAASVVVGRLLPGSTPLAPLVDFPGNGAGPVRARTIIAMEPAALDRAVVAGQGAVLVFENGDRLLPIVTGLVFTGASTPTPFQELLVTPRSSSAPDELRPNRTPVEARLDGERVVLEGKREVILKCGEASITLRSDGRVVLRGTYVETYAKGVNRIKGASVKIN